MARSYRNAGKRPVRLDPRLFPDYEFHPDGSVTRLVPVRRGPSAGSTEPPKTYADGRTGRLYYSLMCPSRGRAVPVSVNQIRAFFGQPPSLVDRDAWYAKDTALPRRRLTGYPWYLSDREGTVFQTHTSGGIYRVARIMALDGGSYRLVNDIGRRVRVTPEEAKHLAGW